jgi:DNA-binding IclR family transcriptional regulator
MTLTVDVTVDDSVRPSRPVRPAPAPAPVAARARTVRSRATDEVGGGADRDGSVKSVMAALDGLDCFADDVELGVSDIARRLGVAKSTAHRLLTSLRSRGLAERNPETGQYRLGVHLFELGQLAQERMRLRQAAMPLLEELRQASGCTVQLAIPGGADVLYVERLETLRGMALMANSGRRLPAHATASGKAIAAYHPELAQRRRVAGFPALTNATIRSAADFDRALALVRRRGVATNLGEARPGICSVAAPVLDASGTAISAISLLAPGEDVRGDLGRPARLVTVAARKLAHGLGV